MQIIRVQNKDGIGCYVSRDILMDTETAVMLDGHNYKNDRPNPYRDNGIKRWPRDNEFSGFASWEQFVNWFTADEIKAMAKNGFYPVMLDADVTVIGERQCLFRRQDERRYRNWT